MTQTVDTYRRAMTYLRVSVIDRCNFRCPYCMPAEEYSKNYKFLNKSEWLSFDEINKAVQAFTDCGVNKVRITGGEPLLRPNIDHLIKQLKMNPAITELSLTTNGSLLYQNAETLKQSGLDRLTVSLDSLEENTFNTLSGNKGILNDVLQGITEAEHVGFKSIKINTVIQKGTNEHSLMQLIDYFRGSPHIVRFIEYMDVGTCNNWDSTRVMPSKEIVDIISRYYPLKPISKNYYGEVADRYIFEDGKGEIGFISSVSQPFCSSCTRVRLSTNGRIYTCLFAQNGHNLQPLLRNNASDAEIQSFIQSIWKKRTDRYSEQRYDQSKKLNKVEMFHIGG